MDKKYWNEYYKNHAKNSEISNASSFAQFCQEKFFKDKKKSILEIGSGNGRDARYFADNSHKIIAVDQSHIGLEALKDEKVSYVEENFVTMDYNVFSDINVVYSRFTLHAIKEQECSVVVDKVSRLLKCGELFAIEARSTKDPLFGQGKEIAPNTWFTDHSRRFIDSDSFIDRILNNNFRILYFTQENNLSVYKDDNPILIRAIFQKKG